MVFDDFDLGGIEESFREEEIEMYDAYLASNADDEDEYFDEDDDDYYGLMDEDEDYYGFDDDDEEG